MRPSAKRPANGGDTTRLLAGFGALVLLALFAVISQNDDFGCDYLAGLKDVLADKYDSAATGATYEISDPTIDSQIVKLKASGADVLAATPKFAAQ